MRQRRVEGGEHTVEEGRIERPLLSVDGKKVEILDDGAEIVLVRPEGEGERLIVEFEGAVFFRAQALQDGEIDAIGLPSQFGTEFGRTLFGVVVDEDRHIFVVTAPLLAGRCTSCGCAASCRGRPTASCSAAGARCGAAGASYRTAGASCRASRARCRVATGARCGAAGASCRATGARCGATTSARCVSLCSDGGCSFCHFHGVFLLLRGEMIFFEEKCFSSRRNVFLRGEMFFFGEKCFSSGRNDFLRGEDVVDSFALQEFLNSKSGTFSQKCRSFLGFLGLFSG